MGQANCAPVRDLWYGPELRPDWKKEPTFDPFVGFPNGRKIRDPKVTLEEMDAHLLPLRRRDYCAYMYIKFLDCKKDNKWPYLPCDLVFQDFQACEHEDFVLRMKEYERERRLMVREARIKSKMARGEM
ncbi:NADH dehydrogenase [ubiquinone] 1 beta subcomplex subunit 7-like [Crassostrea angulata]|uniref:NADH dehydrogenase [ubiquinone] 1 beta subcomplex subunit 7 n=1 Tax=Magallana gigas TaxID=29159 RepID=A0A8W8MWI7_MAGGI|nr:NADH dehydrogenase [ubiquinone] 1 beta subcomplex subunit 7 [Crassostrea gigas]XP_052688855.1 NADH dehydrogenase [ubiquinone] 1 beta subcomplex subunit 7-like [Crassostrea angulata]|eukprot:XP_011445955.1 PREDICTED: NADH dehydrogenase [ubiquinone] 1 beta subcomplex subunit 7-like [Crassostrea gigas]